MVGSQGRICFWQGGSLWMGRGAGRSDWHAHHAHQIAVRLAGTCLFRSDPAEPWTAFDGAIIHSQRKHEFEFDGAIAHIFVEPETAQGRALERYVSGAGISALPQDAWERIAGLLRQSGSVGETGQALVATGQAALAVLTGALAPGVPVDPRVVKAIDFAGARVREPVTLAQAASVAALSPGRFRHLFVAETGAPFRAWLLWLRLNVAIQSAMSGSSWTSAAHEAGFADSAHLTRTFKRMFGINPVELSGLTRGSGAVAGESRP